MLFKALVGLLLATSHNFLAAEGACNFPPDYLPPDLSSITNTAIQDTVYVYTDTFGNCSGCVTELSVCYVAYSTPNPMKVFVVDDENTIVHVHSFTGPTTSTENMDTYCEPFGSFSLCCSYLPLAPSEQFVVRSTDHYGVWYSEQLAFRASNEERGHYVTPELTPLEVGVNINSSIYDILKIYFHLIISPGIKYWWLKT
ncbi:hypothetical protein GBAR_LOCUS29101 [Geodia barretti]|uniref:Uncharacterized protein n=1 Tax=Geodia barretti TaxID=519541 RepID=A0AA35TRP0_GEOBA|nr:hypothetical protein GBAR_LOCUS29101 [Geodia barretti]